MRAISVGEVTIGTGAPPRIMGVVNLSPESPYSPSVFEKPENAAHYIESDLVQAGAEIVDIGLESANKRFSVRSADWELSRLDLAIETMERVSVDTVFSIETRYHEVAEVAIEAGFDMVNDICGFADPEMPVVCDSYNVPVVKMASPPDLERPGAVQTVDEIYDALRRGGLTEKTIVDPAFGGWSEEKTIRDDHEIFRRLREFRGLDRPMLVSINRKNFLGEIVGRDTPDRLPASLAATALAVERGADVIRTHDVSATRDAALVGEAYSPPLIQENTVRELSACTSEEVDRHLARLDLDKTGADRVMQTFELRVLDDRDRDEIQNLVSSVGGVVSGNEAGMIVSVTPAMIDQLVREFDAAFPDIARAFRREQ